MTQRRVRGVIFDFGDTLVSLQPSREELFLRATRSIGLKLSLEAVKSAYRVVGFQRKYSSLAIRHPKEKEAFYREYNRDLCRALGISRYFERLIPEVVEVFRRKGNWRLVSHARWVLYQLSRCDVVLALLANWNRTLPQETERLGIKKYLSAIVASQEVGLEKPDVRIFECVLRALCLSPSENCVLYVGNEYETDILGARDAGLVPVLIDRNRYYLHADCMRFDSISGWYQSLLLLQKEIKINVGSGR